MTRRNNHEHDHQCALFRWAALHEKRYPELKLLHASANGGKRNLIVAMKLKKSGVKAGVPDICLPVSRGTYHALYIELKVGKGKPSPAQLSWQALLKMHGNLAIVAYGWEEARQMIERYLTLEGKCES